MGCRDVRVKIVPPKNIDELLIGFVSAKAVFLCSYIGVVINLLAPFLGSIFNAVEVQSIEGRIKMAGF